MSIRTRFAPSPTGDLHLGGARTALYAWLYARKCGGQFLLRIEDTDQKRSTQQALDAIFKGLQWLGLDWDEEPWYQSKRKPRYDQVLEQLLQSGQAYRCYCSKERLDELRQEQLANKQIPQYDRCCRDKNHGPSEEPHVIRFKTPLQGEIVVEDAVYGQVHFHNEQLDDVILQRSDGFPTYHFSVVVDDWDAQITHVIRGDDHLNNTPRQMHIIKALGAPLPTYAHLPMILGQDGKKMSKRHGTVSVIAYREQGYLADALINYLARLGWSHGDQEVFSRQALVDLFDLKHLNKAAATFDPHKLIWLNQHYLKETAPDKVAKELAWMLRHKNISSAQGPKLTELVEAFRTRVENLAELAEKSRCFYEPLQGGYQPDMASQYLTHEQLPWLQNIHNHLESLSLWQAPSLKDTVKKCLKEQGIKMPQLAQPIRVALTGDTASPSIDITLYLMGREATLKRIEAAVLYIENHS
jgi:glutamyl-tRNA synthetase